MQLLTLDLQTNNLAAMEAFYHGVLELPVVEKTKARIVFSIGYSTLAFTYTPRPVGIYHFALLIPKNTVAIAYQWLKARTPVLPFNEAGDVADFSNWNAEAFYFHDPHQNIVEFIAHHDLDHTCNEPFTAAAIAGICEIGLVVDDVATACKALHQNYGLPYFSKGPYLNDFAVMGEEDGLLIVSAAGRGWLPTGQPAAPNKLKITFQLNGQVQVLTERFDA